MRQTVTDEDTAIALGSGDVPVLATPRLIAWLEAETVARAAELIDAGETTVGTAIRVKHLCATAVGGEVTVTAAPPSRDGQRLTFAVTATDGQGRLLADGEIERMIVDRERFLARS